MPDPLYQRLFGCAELSTRTASTFAPEKFISGVRSNVKAGVAIRMGSQLVPVEIHRSIAVNAIEFNAHALAVPISRSVKRLAIPAVATGEKPLA